MKINEPLDEETYLKVHTAIDLAEVRGLDPAEMLHRRGLVASAVLIKQVKSEVLRDLHQTIAGYRPAEFLRRNTSSPSSPKDMYDAILAFIEEYVRKEQNAAL
jgi:hypothetical protein